MCGSIRWPFGPASEIFCSRVRAVAMPWVVSTRQIRRSAMAWWAGLGRDLGARYLAIGREPGERKVRHPRLLPRESPGCQPDAAPGGILLYIFSSIAPIPPQRRRSCLEVPWVEPKELHKGRHPAHIAISCGASVGGSTILRQIPSAHGTRNRRGWSCCECAVNPVTGSVRARPSDAPRGRAGRERSHAYGARP